MKDYQRLIFIEINLFVPQPSDSLNKSLLYSIGKITSLHVVCILILVVKFLLVK